MLHALATASEVRGIDATGYAHNRNGALLIYKRPIPGHKMQFRISDQTSVIMAHTRMTTQGDERINRNNHPFHGVANEIPFALAHNGVLYNDKTLRKALHLPDSRIETDSYVAVQLLEMKNALNFDSLKYMAEQVRGSFTFTVLDNKNNLYFVKGDSPMCLYHFKQSGLFLYASTREILCVALEHMRWISEPASEVFLNEGEILCIKADGQMNRSSFENSFFVNDVLFHSAAPYHANLWHKSGREEYIDDLKSVAASEGYAPEMIDRLLLHGFTPWEIEEFIYDGGC